MQKSSTQNRKTCNYRNNRLLKLGFEKKAEEKK